MERPIPKPRRTILDIPTTKYENVTIDGLKKLTISDDECPRLKSPQYNNVFINDDDSRDDRQFTKTDLINDKDENKDKDTSSTKRPIPAPRRSNCEIYERIDFKGSDEIDKSPQSSQQPGYMIHRKPPDVVPQIPPKSFNNTATTQRSPSVGSNRSKDKQRIRSISVDSPTGFFIRDGSYKLHKSTSNSTINSSVSSTSSNDALKYKNPSPSDILKSLGTTSKLLSESISERVAIKAKGAKNKIDRSLSNWGYNTTSRLKSVRKKMNSFSAQTFSTLKSEKKTKDDSVDHRQTVPSDDKLFSKIQFDSPLRKVGSMSDLTITESVYDIPKNAKPINSFSPNSTTSDYICTPFGKFSPIDPDNVETFNRNTKTTQSCVNYKKSSIETPQDNSTTRNNSDPTLYNVKVNIDGINNSKENDDIEIHTSNESLPMPNFPAPVLRIPSVDIPSEIQPPVRLKRKKNSLNMDVRQSSSDLNSNRATFDPTELAQLASISSRDVSLEIAEDIAIQEQEISKADRSDSWTYQEGSDSSIGSIDPIYANVESTYGKICQMKSDDAKSILKPNFESEMPKMERINSQRPLSISCLPSTSKDIIYEFDPLKKQATTTSKTNELLFLADLLEGETYKTLPRNGVSLLSMEDDQSVESESDDDNSSVGTELPVPPERLDSLPHVHNKQSPAESNKNVQIIHQNIKLHTRKLEKVSEEIVKPFLSKVEEPAPISKNEALATGGALPKQQTQWYLEQSSKPPARPPKQTKKDDVQWKDSEAPPPYSEVAKERRINMSIPSVPPVETRELQRSESAPETSPTQRSSMKSVFTNVLNKVDFLSRKASFRSRTSDVQVIIEMVPKPSLSQILVVHSGHLIRLPSGGVEDILKEMQTRRAMLRERKFQTYLDKSLKESIPLEHITTIQCVNNHKYTNNSLHLYCFELTATAPKNQSSAQAFSNPNIILTANNSANLKTQRSCYLYGVAKESERDVWMQKILESLTNVFPKPWICQFYRAGWCYVKNSVTSPWAGAWLLLHKRKRRLTFYSQIDMNVEKVDLRKARCIVLNEKDDSIKNLHVQSGPILTIDCPPHTIYLIMSCPRETKIWGHIIREVSFNNGPGLSDQQLTKCNVPVVVDKCINYIYIHGSMSEGIYRKSGMESNISKLITAFRSNAFNVEITRPEYSEHDVANVLKRFMRDLPERLLGKHTVSFISITDLKLVNEKITAYKELLSRLSQIEYQTLKKLIGHLTFIQSQASINKMSSDNLATVWGPTLFEANEIGYSQDESSVVIDLIELYKHLFMLTPEEIIKEQKMLKHLQKYYAYAENQMDPVKQSGDLKIWIGVNAHPSSKQESRVGPSETQFNITLTPNKTVYEVCKELAPKMNFSPYEVTLNEIILDGALIRPMHHTERLFETVINWSYWPEADRKNNYLELQPITIINDVNRALRNLATVTPAKELSFVDNKTKSFKMYQMEISNDVLAVLKKDKGTHSIKEIALNCVTAYLGCEKKRECQSRWAITLIPHGSQHAIRSKDSPYVGHVIAGNELKDKIIWLSAIWNSLYKNDILPPAEFVIP